MFITYFRQKLHPCIQLISNTSWLLGSEFLAKLSRIFTIVALTSTLTPISYGTAMLALAAHDMMSFLLRAGAGTQIIQCESDELADVAKNGAAIQWCICITLATFQFLLADVIANIYNNPDLVNLLKVMAFTYVLYPWVSIRVFLLHRKNAMRWFSLRMGVCTIVENLSIALFVLFGADIMAVAYGKIIFALLWLLLFSFADVKSYGIGFKLPIFKRLFKTSSQLCSSEFLKSLRMNADTFIAGKLLSPELFGFYIFAKNAGIGISQSIGNVFSSALFPFLCKLQRQGALYNHKRMIYSFAVGVGSIFIMQALFVPYYVPVIFDPKWHSTIPIVSIICLVALPTVLVDTFCNFKRAEGAYHSETLIRLACLLITVGMLLIFWPNQPMDFAIVLLSSSLIWCVFLYLFKIFHTKKTSFFTYVNRRKSHEYS